MATCGFPEMSYATLLIPLISLMMRFDTRPNNSCANTIIFYPNPPCKDCCGKIRQTLKTNNIKFDAIIHQI
jgi:hypothetical protein